MPVYASFTDLTNTVLQLAPTLTSDIGSHTIDVTVTDSVSSSTGSFILSILNTDPSYASSLVT